MSRNLPRISECQQGRYGESNNSVKSKTSLIVWVRTVHATVVIAAAVPAVWIGRSDLKGQRNPARYPVRAA